MSSSSLTPLYFSFSASNSSMKINEILEHVSIQGKETSAKVNIRLRLKNWSINLHIQNNGKNNNGKDNNCKTNKSKRKIGIFITHTQQQHNTYQSTFWRSLIIESISHCKLLLRTFSDVISPETHECRWKSRQG